MKAVIVALCGALALAGAGGPAGAQTAPDPHPVLREVARILSPNAPPQAVLGEVGRTVPPTGVDEAKAVDIGGIRQWITVRGRDRRNPILLLIHGGPAAPELPNRYIFEAPWTDYFTVVEWDQRGSGKTFGLNDPEKVAPTMSEERIVADAEELVAYLRTTYTKRKIFVMGHSWGTVVG